MVVTRPLLLALNGLANRLLRRVGVEPVDEVGEGRNPDDLRELVLHSARTGALDAEERDRLVTALDLDRAPLREVVRPGAEVASVPADATPDAIRAVSRRSGHLRLLVTDPDGRPVGVVHVRDALTGTASASAIMRPVPTLSAGTPLHDALGAMRDGRNHLALVAEGDVLLGLVTLQDLLDRLLPAGGNTGYTRGVKIAVSVPDDLFARADDAANRLGWSRSQVYARALEEFLDAHGEDHDPVTTKLNEIADLQEPGIGGATARRLIETGQWEW